MSTLLITTRGYRSTMTESLFEQMSIVNQYNEPVDLLTTQKTSIGVDRLEELSGIKIRHVNNQFSGFNDEIIPKCKTWIDVYEAIDVSRLKSYKRIIMFGQPLSANSGIHRGSKRDGVFPYDHQQLKFQSTAAQLILALAAMKAHRSYNIPFYEVIYDQQEFATTSWHNEFSVGREDSIFFGYSDSRPEFSYKRLDSLQYHIEHNDSGLPFDVPVKDIPKSIDFAFGYTILLKDREWIRDYVKDVVNILSPHMSNVELFVKDKFMGIDTSVNREQYLDKITRAKYTLIASPYDTTTASVLRVIESLACGCLPLFQEGSNMGLLVDAFDVDLSKLILTDAFIPLTEDVRCDTIEYLRGKFKFMYGLPT